MGPSLVFSVFDFIFGLIDLDSFGAFDGGKTSVVAVALRGLVWLAILGGVVGLVLYSMGLV